MSGKKPRGRDSRKGAFRTVTMAKEVLEGDIASLEVVIKEELEFIDLEEGIEALDEALTRLEQMRKEYIAKTVALSKLALFTLHRFYRY